MKQYPSIPSSNGNSFREYRAMHCWEKLDGSNLRFEWNRKNGWHRFGTRTQMMDENTEIYGPAIPKFLSEIGPYILKRFPKAQNITAFCEWLGPNSFAGTHRDLVSEMGLYLLDMTEDNKGFLSPGGFINAFYENIPTPKYYGQFNWTRGFVAHVAEGRLNDTLQLLPNTEGVVGKIKTSKTVSAFAKAKTNWWKEKLRATCKTEREYEALV